MALSTYADLIAAVPAYITRRDASESLIQTWIALGEARINRELRTNKMLQRADADITDEYSATPGDFMAPRSIRLWDAPYTPLAFLSPEQMAAFKGSQPSGVLTAWAMIGGQFWYLPVPTSTVKVELVYYKAIPPLTTTNTSNWVLTYHPDLYLAAACLEAAFYYEDDDAQQRWQGKFDSALMSIHEADKRDTFAATMSPTPSTSAA